MRLLIALLLCLSLALAMGCGRRCTAVEAAMCATDLSTCQNACGGDSQCLQKCTDAYCNCLHDKGCDKANNCN